METSIQYSEWAERMLPNLNPQKHSPKRMTATYYLSDDNTHCASYHTRGVWDTARKQDVMRMLQGLPLFNWFTLLSDGGPAHYKNVKALWELSRLSKKIAEARRLWLASDSVLEQVLAVQFPQNDPFKWMESMGHARPPTPEPELPISPPEPELPINEGEGRLVSEVDRVCALLHKTKAQLVDMLCFSVYVERHFLAPYKGKNNWDGLTGIKKNMCRRAELHDEVRMHCATDVLGFFLEADAKKQSSRALLPTGDKEPVSVGARSTYAVDQEWFVEWKETELELMRSKLPELDSVPGTRSNFQWEARGEGYLGKRWLACLCTICDPGSKTLRILARDCTACVDLEYLGQWVEARIRSHGRDRGVAARMNEQRALLKKYRECLIPGALVAVYASGDHIARRRLWFGRVAGPVFTVEPNQLHCEASDFYFKKNDVVFTVLWYEFLSDAETDDLNFTPLGDVVHYVYASTVRSAGQELEDGFAAANAGGEAEAEAEGDAAAAPRRSGRGHASTAMAPAAVEERVVAFTLSAATMTAVTKSQVTVFKDFDPADIV